MTCRQRAWITVEPVMFVYMFASFLTYPTFQQLLYDSVCSITPNCTSSSNINTTNDTTTSSDQCDETDNASSNVEGEVRTVVSHWILYNNLAASIPTIIVSLLYGSISDSYGRRTFIALPAVGGALNAIIVLIVSHYLPHAIHLYLVGSFLTGVTGSFSAFNFAMYSYMADISVPKYRTARLSVLESMMYLGASLSSFTSGVWIHREGYSSPYWGIFACYVFVVVYTVFLLPFITTDNRSNNGSGIQSSKLSINSSSDDNISWQAVEQLTALSRLTAIFQRISQFFSLLAKSWRLSLLCVIFFCIEVNFLGITDIVILYSINRLCWSPEIIGLFLGSKVFVSAVAAIFIAPLLALCGVADTTIVLAGLVSGIGALVSMGTATKTWMMLLAPFIGCLRGCVIPVLRSMLSKSTPPTYHGVMFSGISMIEASSMLIATSLYNALFPKTYSIDPGFCFYLMILFLLVPMGCTVILHLKQSNRCNNTRCTESEEDVALL